MPGDKRYVVYEARRLRDPKLAARVVAADGHTFHVIREDGLRTREYLPLMFFDDAITEAFRRAGRPRPRE